MKKTYWARDLVQELVSMALPILRETEGHFLKKVAKHLGRRIATDLALVLWKIYGIPLQETGKKFARLAKEPSLENIVITNEDLYTNLLVQGKEHFPVGKPTIVVPTHPTGLVDWLVTVGTVRTLVDEWTPVKVLARAELSWIDWIEAVNTESKSWNKIDKKAALERAKQIFEQQWVIVLFPAWMIWICDEHGVVQEQRRKWSALQAAHYLSDLDVHIQPVNIESQLPSEWYKHIAHSKTVKNSIVRMMHRAKWLLTLANSVNEKNMSLTFRAPLWPEQIRKLCEWVENDKDWALVTERLRQYTLTGQINI